MREQGGEREREKEKNKTDFQYGRKGVQSLEKEIVMWDNWGVSSVKKGGKSVEGNANGN